MTLCLPPPRRGLRACVLVPARDEEARLPHLVASLADQRDATGTRRPGGSYEVLVLLNNCRDGSADALRAEAKRHPSLVLHAAEVEFAPHEAHVGRARQLLFDTGAARLALGGLLLTTDADSRVPPDWIASAEAEVAAGADLVGGRVTLEPAERAALDPGVRRLFLLDIGYRRALEELRSLLAPEPHDPFPRHHQHYGACLAVTTAAYAAAGGMPLVRTSEDVALVRAVERAGGRVRHSYRFRAATSARAVGRAEGGLADAVEWWGGCVRDGRPVLVESAAAAERRLRQLGRWHRASPGVAPPAALLSPPEPPPPDDGDEISRVLRDLRAAVARLRPLPLEARLGDAGFRPAPPACAVSPLPALAA